MLCVITTMRLLLSVDRPNDEGRKFKQIHKVDGPHKVSRLQSTMWTDPMTRVENLKKSTKWTDHTKRSRLQSTMWTDPMTRVENKSINGRTSQRVKTIVHNMDRSKSKDH